MLYFPLIPILGESHALQLKFSPEISLEAATHPAKKKLPPRLGWFGKAGSNCRQDFTEGSTEHP